MSDFPIPFGRYQLMERLAVGGMAELFLAQASGPHGFEKIVVIKRILPALAADKQFTAMFISEAKLTAKLSHPKIAQTYELGTFNDQLYIAMEFVDGLDVLAVLKECAHRKMRMPPEVIVYIGMEVLDALDFAHKQKGADGELLGIVHRDISPSNVLLSRRGDVKLVDFGIAHAVASDHKTQAGTLKGKYGYMSPEQVMGEGVSAKSDLFSVGILLVEMLTGRRLFAARNELDVLLMVRDVKLERYEKFGSHVPKTLDVLVRKALAKDADKRYEDALEFREVLDEWLFENRMRVGQRQVRDLVEDLFVDADKRRKVFLAEHAATVPPGQGIAPLPKASEDDNVGEIDGIPSGVLRISDSIPHRRAVSEADVEVSILDEAPGEIADIELGLAGNTPIPQTEDAGEDVSFDDADDDDDDELSFDIDLESPPPEPAKPKRPRRTSTKFEKMVDPDEPVEPVPDDKAARESAVAVAEEAAKPKKKKKKKTRDPRREESDPSLTPDKPGVLGLSDGIPVPASLVGDESVPIFIDDADLSVRFPTIQAAVEAVSPMAPDPASRDFDDQEVSSVSAPAGRRPPSPRSIKHPKPSIEAVARASKPKVMQMEDIADTPTETGSVAKTPAIRVLFERALGKATGLLVCSVGGIRKEIYIRDGVPEFVASNVAGELFGSYLVKNDAISQGELAMALAMMPHYGGKLGDTLVGLGLMKPLDVFRHLTRQVRQKLIDVCTWEKGTYTWYIDRESPRKAFPLDIDPYEVLGAGAMALPGSMVDRWVDKHVNLMPEAARRPAVPPERFQLGDEVRAVYDTLDGERSIPELLERFTNDEDRLRYLRILFLLVETQLAT